MYIKALKLNISSVFNCKLHINLGSQVVHEKAPHIKSLMIAGPRGVGKKMLAHAICTETGANMFDLTPANIATKYPGKAGLNMLLHMVFKVKNDCRITVISALSCTTCIFTCR